MAEGVSGVGLLEVLALRNGLNFLIFIVAIVFGLVFVATVAVIWGSLVLIGGFLIFIAFILLILNKGQRTDKSFPILIALGIIFIMLHLIGVELGTIDLSIIPGLQGVHDFFNPGGGCMGCP